MKKVTKEAVGRARAAMKRVRDRNALVSRPQRTLTSAELAALATKKEADSNAKPSVWERVPATEQAGALSVARPVDVRPPESQRDRTAREIRAFDRKLKEMGCPTVVIAAVDYDDDLHMVTGGRHDTLALIAAKLLRLAGV
jgi:hypothetical protein